MDLGMDWDIEFLSHMKLMAHFSSPSRPESMMTLKHSSCGYTDYKRIHNIFADLSPPKLTFLKSMHNLCTFGL